MTRPWQRREQHRRQGSAQAVEALCVVMAQHLPRLGDAGRAYLDTLGAWCRGDAKTRALSVASNAVDSNAVSRVQSTVDRIAQYPTHTQAAIDARLRAMADTEGLDLPTLVDAWQQAFRTIQRAEADATLRGGR
jgi:hypothetical protein